MRVWLVIGALGGLLAVTAVAALAVWTELGDTSLSTGGMVALVLGVTFSLLLGGGLMFLVFYSSRKGYDDMGRRGEDDPAR